jgi:hypothetical protein
MTRAEIIAQLDAELSRLERARDYLTAALKGSKNVLGSLDIKLPVKARKQAALPKLMVSTPQKAIVVAAAAPSPARTQEPQVNHVPPRRRVERRQATSEKPGKSPAALSGTVPAGPVVVSANEARKHERVVVAAPKPVAAELRSEIGSERTLGSLIQAFERRTGFNGAETP